MYTLMNAQRKGLQENQSRALKQISGHISEVKIIIPPHTQPPPPPPPPAPATFHAAFRHQVPLRRYRIRHGNTVYPFSSAMHCTPVAIWQIFTQSTPCTRETQQLLHVSTRMLEGGGQAAFFHACQRCSIIHPAYLDSVR